MKKNLHPINRRAKRSAS